MPTDVQRLLREYVDAYLDFHPTTAAALGLHQYDGQIGDYSETGIAARVRALEGFGGQIEAVDRAVLSPQEAHDLDLIEASRRHELFDWAELRDHEYDPLGHSFLLDATTYLKRDYAPLPERAQALSAHLEAVPDALHHARSHLTRRPTPRPILETAREAFQGHVGFYERDLPAALAALDDPPVYDRFLRAQAQALDALRSFLRWLDEEAAPRATDDFAIGERLFGRMLATGELVDTPLAQLVRMGEEELRRLTEAAEAAARDLEPGLTPAEAMSRLGAVHPPEAALLDATRGMLEELRTFVVERGLVTVPSEVRPIVEATPPFLRFGFAFMDTAGPFEETAAESFYYVTPPEPDWPPEQREEWLREFNVYSLRNTSIHEAYPGHYVHFLTVKAAAPSRPARVFTAYSLVEGWAHYAEEMMLEEGVDSSPAFRLAALGGLLVRNVRYLAAIKMHTGEMALEEAARLFRERAFMEAHPARKEAVRGTFDPGYLNYTLGRFMLRRLREDVQREEGTAFSLRAFHDRLLALGAPPLPLARRALLRHDTGRLL